MVHLNYFIFFNIEGEGEGRNRGEGRGGAWRRGFAEAGGGTMDGEDGIVGGGLDMTSRSSSLDSMSASTSRESRKEDGELTNEGLS